MRFVEKPTLGSLTSRMTRLRAAAVVMIVDGGRNKSCLLLGRIECDLRQSSTTRAFVLLRQLSPWRLALTLLSWAAPNEPWRRLAKTVGTPAASSALVGHKCLRC
jgi:hypothetical protein